MSQYYRRNISQTDIYHFTLVNHVSNIAKGRYLQRHYHQRELSVHTKGSSVTQRGMQILYETLLPLFQDQNLIVI